MNVASACGASADAVPLYPAANPPDRSMSITIPLAASLLGTLCCVFMIGFSTQRLSKARVDGGTDDRAGFDRAYPAV
jgi:hypothetical protein